MKKLITLIFLLNLSFCFSQSLGNLQEEKIKTATEFAEKYLYDNKIPGMSISVSKKGNIIWSIGFGYSNIEKKIKVSPNKTQFRIASISKSLTALALVKLAGRKQLKLDESIYTYIPDFPKKKHDFTVRQVAGHIAGIRHYNGNEFILDKKMSIVEGLGIFKDSPLKFKPGSAYSYSTYGWNLLSVVIQNASKTEFNKYMLDYIFNPLKMHSTTVDASGSDMPNRTQFYRKTNTDRIVLGPSVNNEYKVAGGGFISTSEDLIRFGNEIITPTIIWRYARNELVKPQLLDSGESTNYGIGFHIGQTKTGTPKYSHSGGGIGASTLLLIFPKEEIVISILTNLSQAPINEIGEEMETIFID
jgi:CubicO group peptidase (beta-lactamase class C family)